MRERDANLLEIIANIVREARQDDVTYPKILATPMLAQALESGAAAIRAMLAVEQK